jgi:O-antigen/teichoic acid export membrane protein
MGERPRRRRELAIHTDEFGPAEAGGEPLPPRGRGGEPVARGLALLAAGQGVCVLSGYVINVFLAKRLGPADYGLFGLVLSALVWLEITISGIGNLAVVYVGRRGLDPELRGIFWRAQAAASSCVFLACLLPSLAAWAAGSRIGFLFAVASLDLAVIGFYHLGSGFLNGLRWYTGQSLSSIAYSVSRAAAMVVLCLAGLGLGGAFAGNVVSSVCGLLAALAFLGLAERGGGFSSLEGAADLPPVPTLVRESLSFVAIPLIYSLILFMDIWFVGALRPGEDGGVFVSAHTVSRIVVFILSAVSMAAFPAFVSAFAAGDRGRALRLFRGLGDLLLGGALPLALLLSVFAGPMVRILFGGAYESAALSLALLAPAHLLLMSLTLFVYVLFAADRRGTALLILASAAALDACLQPLFISLWGPAGAAAATLASSLAGAAALFPIGRELGLTWERGRSLLLGTLALSCFLLPALIPAGTLGKAAACLAFLAVYLLALRRAGLVTGRELANWYNMVRGRLPEPERGTASDQSEEWKGGRGG